MASEVPTNYYDWIGRRWRDHTPKAGRRKALAIPDLCPRCARGIHAYRHGDTGCTQRLAKEPYDYVCLCAKPRSDQTGAILSRLRLLSKG